MKKTLLAAALLAGFATAGVAQAETSVTLYGILDTGYGYSQMKYSHTNAAGVAYDAKTTSSGLKDGFLNGNRFGLKGSEDLGDGLRAIFQLEQGFNIGDGTFAADTRQFHRQAYVGLASDNWGTFTMGRQYNFGDGYHDASFGSSFGDTDKAFGAKSVRVDKMFKYETPDFAGFKAGIGYAAGQSVDRESVNGVAATAAATDDRSNYLTVGLKYANGPIFAGATYDRVGSSGQVQNGWNTTTNAPQDAQYNVTNWMISGGYDFEVVKLGLGYGQDRNGKLNGMLGSVTNNPAARGFNVDGFKSHNYYVGLSAPLGGGTAAVTWTRSSSNLDDVYNDQDNTYKTQNIYAAKYSYPLSKRTAVYAYGAYGTGIAYLDGQKGKEAGIGLNHKF